MDMFTLKLIHQRAAPDRGRSLIPATALPGNGIDCLINAMDLIGLYVARYDR